MTQRHVNSIVLLAYMALFSVAFAWDGDWRGFVLVLSFGIGAVFMMPARVRGPW